MSDKAFKNMGYKNASGFVVPCCDDSGYRVRLVCSLLTA